MRRLISMLLPLLAATACELAPDDGTRPWGVPDATVTADSFGAEAAVVSTPANGATSAPEGAPPGLPGRCGAGDSLCAAVRASEVQVGTVRLVGDPGWAPVPYVMHGDPEPWRAPPAGQGASTPAVAAGPTLP